MKSTFLIGLGLAVLLLAGIAWKKRPKSAAVAEWYRISWDDAHILLDVHPPGQATWSEQIPWNTIVRVCYEPGDYTVSDGLYLFSSLRPESWTVPTEADGGPEFVGELVARGLFSAELLLEAMEAGEGVFCWPGEVEAIEGAGGRGE